MHGQQPHLQDTSRAIRDPARILRRIHVRPLQ